LFVQCSGLSGLREANAGGMKILRISTNISLYLGNDKNTAIVGMEGE